MVIPGPGVGCAFGSRAGFLSDRNKIVSQESYRPGHCLKKGG
jgi:hypothetical protein